MNLVSVVFFKSVRAGRKLCSDIDLEPQTLTYSRPQGMLSGVISTIIIDGPRTSPSEITKLNSLGF